MGRTEGIIFKRVEGWLKLLYKKSEGEIWERKKDYFLKHEGHEEHEERIIDRFYPKAQRVLVSLVFLASKVS